MFLRTFRGTKERSSKRSADPDSVPRKVPLSKTSARALRWTVYATLAKIRGFDAASPARIHSKNDFDLKCERPCPKSTYLRVCHSSAEARNVLRNVPRNVLRFRETVLGSSADH